MNTALTSTTKSMNPTLIDRQANPLYGREAEYQAIEEAFIGSRQSGKSRLVLIKGPSGVGKTTLVHHLQARLNQDVFFLEGKFYQYNQSQPFQAITQIIDQFERRIAALPAQSYKALKSKWQEDLAPFIDLLQLLAPNSGLLSTAEDIDITELSANQAQLRDAMQAMFHNMAESCEALVIFMDDLQWADKDSIATLQSLWLQLSDIPVLFIASYRAEEVDANHPVAGLVSEVEGRPGMGRVISLDSFSQDTVTEWLAIRLKNVSGSMSELGEVVWRKTLGNPFYLNQFYQLLMDNASISRKEPALPWEWDLNEIEGQAGTENLVPALRRRLDLLGDDTLSVLKWAACLGTSFDIDMLSSLTGLSAYQLDRSLEEARKMEFVLPRNTYNGNVEYVIAHDQIQRALYELLGADQKAAHHRAIAQKFIERPKTTATDIYHIANHFSLCDHAEDEDEKKLRRKYNHKAGKQALASTAYTRAYEYFKQSAGHFTDEDWQTHYDTTLDYYISMMEVAGYNNDVDTVNRLFEEVNSHDIKESDKVRLLQLYSLLHIYFKEYKAGYDHALEALQNLGINVAKTPEEIGAAMGVLVPKLADPEVIARFENLHEAKEEDEIIHTLFNQLCVYAYNVAPMEIAYYTFLWAEATLERGITAAATDAYSFVAMVYTSMLNLDVAFRYGDLTEQVAGHFNHPIYKSKALSLVYSHCLVWKSPYDRTMEVMEEHYMPLIRYGEWIWAGGTLFNTYVVALTQGADLKQADERHDEFYQEYAKPEAQQIFGFLPHEAIRLLSRYLLVTGELTAEADKVLAEGKESNPMISSVALTILARLYTLAGAYDKALEVGEANHAAMVQHGACGGQIHNLVFHFDYALALARKKMGGIDLGADEEKLGQSLERLALYATTNPENFGVYHTLAMANVKMAEEDNQAAYGLFMEAIKQAQANGMTLPAAMAFEHMGELAAREGLHIAKGHYIEAFHLYRQCGAEGKAKEILHKRLQGSLSQMVIEQAEAGEPGIMAQASDLDVQALMDSSLTLSRQVKLDQLLRQLMEIISRNTSAERVIIALQRGDELYLEGVHTPAETRVMEEIALSEPNKIPELYRLSVEIVNAVANTSNTVLLGDAFQTAGPYKNTAYIQQKQPKSILCMPLMHQGDLMGALYLENNSQAYAFTRDRLEILTLLSAQITTSIRNAGMYSNLEAKIAQRTHELQITNRELEAMSEFKEKLTGLIAHDLKSPLSNIIGLSEQAPGQETHQKINQLSRYMEQMILDILETRRLESPEMKPVLKEIAVGRLIENALEQLAWVIDDRHIRVTVKGFQTVKALADERLIVRVLVNLINNAIVHNPDAKEITVRAEKSGENTIRLSIEDQGKPMSQEVADRIFEAYQSNTAGSNPRYRSTGLGLTYCKLAVESHQGEIGVKPGEETGNTFWFTLPCLPNQATGEATEYEYGAVEGGQSLTDEEVNILRPYVQELQAYQVNQLTAILTTLRNIPVGKHPALSQWVDDVEQATYACDETRYRELINLIPLKNATEK